MFGDFGLSYEDIFFICQGFGIRRPYETYNFSRVIIGTLSEKVGCLLSLLRALLASFSTFLEFYCPFPSFLVSLALDFPSDKAKNSSLFRFWLLISIFVDLIYLKEEGSMFFFAWVIYLRSFCQI